MRRRHIEIRGPAKKWVAVGVLVFIAWSVFGRGFFDFNLGFFNRGYQTSFLRGGHFEKRGLHWSQQDLTLGHIVSLGGEVAELEVDARIGRGNVVLHAWRWPAFLYDEPTVGRLRLSEDGRASVEVPLESVGLYVLSVTGSYFGGDLTVDWRVEDVR